MAHIKIMGFNPDVFYCTIHCILQKIFLAGPLEFVLGNSSVATITRSSHTGYVVESETELECAQQTTLQGLLSRSRAVHSCERMRTSLV